MMPLKTIYKPALYLLLLLALAPFVALSFYNYPAADDLILTHVARNLGVWENIQTVYMNWSGRYFGTFIVSVNPLVYNFNTGYLLLPVLLIILLYIGIYFTVAPVLSKRGIIGNHGISLMLLLVFIELLRSPVEAFYWISGALTYTLPFCMLLFLLALLFSPSKSLFTILAACVLSFLIAGSNEIILVFSIEILLIILGYRLVKKDVPLKIILANTMMLAGALILLMSPGNSKRMDFFSTHGHITDSLVSSVMSGFRIAIYVIKEPVVIVLLLAAFIMSIKKQLRFEELRLKKKTIVFVACISGLIIISLYFPGYYAMGMPPPPRIHNTVILIFIFLLFINIIFIGNYFSRISTSRLSKTPDGITKILFIISIVFLFTSFEKKPDEVIYPTGNIAKAWNDLLFNARPYQQEMNERIENVIMAKQYHNDSLILKPIHNRPATLFYLDITENPNHWINISFREYYHLKYVKLQDNK